MIKKNKIKDDELLMIENLSVEYRTDDNVYKAVNNVSIKMKKGETLGLVGESGAGKSTLALSIMRLLPNNIGFVTDGKIYVSGQDINKLSKLEMQRLRGFEVSMVFQDPMTSLNPLMTVEEQVAEVINAHQTLPKDKVSAKVDELLELVGIQTQRKVDYPHQFSGGMKQRVVIAMALACESKLVIADEPTTALDVTIQAQVLAMINDLKEKLGTSIILITHDLGVVAAVCDNVSIMYCGEIIESGTVEDIYSKKIHHPYTVGLFGSIPDLSKRSKRLNPISGLMPDSSQYPKGCKFHDRCPFAEDVCKNKEPIYYVEGTHSIKCHKYTGEL